MIKVIVAQRDQLKRAEYIRKQQIRFIQKQTDEIIELKNELARSDHLLGDISKTARNRLNEITRLRDIARRTSHYLQREYRATCAPTWHTNALWTLKEVNDTPRSHKNMTAQEIYDEQK